MHDEEAPGTRGTDNILVGCGDSDVEEGSLHDQMVGMWVTDHGEVYKVFHDDGTYRTAHSPERALGDDEVFPGLEWGTWSVADDVLTFEANPDAPHCVGLPATYKVEISDDGDRMLTTLVEDEYTVRADDFSSGLIRHSDTTS